MDDLDKDVARLLGIDPQTLETQPHEAVPGLVAPRRPGRRVAVASAAALSVAVLSALTIMRPLPPPIPSAHSAAGPKLDVFMDRQTTGSSPEQSAAETADATAEQLIIRPHPKAQAQFAQAIKRRHEARSLRKGRLSLNDALQIARADTPRPTRRSTGGEAARTVDFYNQTRTASETEAQKTLVEERLEALDAIRLLRQR